MVKREKNPEELSKMSKEDLTVYKYLTLNLNYWGLNHDIEFREQVPCFITSDGFGWLIKKLAKGENTIHVPESQFVDIDTNINRTYVIVVDEDENSIVDKIPAFYIRLANRNLEQIKKWECRVCGTTNNLIQHHIDYESDFTVSLCQKCHSNVHKHPKEYPGFKPVNKRGLTEIAKEKPFLDEDVFEIIKKIGELNDNNIEVTTSNLAKSVFNIRNRRDYQEKDRYIREKLKSLNKAGLVIYKTKTLNGKNIKVYDINEDCIIMKDVAINITTENKYIEGNRKYSADTIVYIKKDDEGEFMIYGIVNEE